MPLNEYIIKNVMMPNVFKHDSFTDTDNLFRNYNISRDLDELVSRIHSLVVDGVARGISGLAVDINGPTNNCSIVRLLTEPQVVSTCIAFDQLGKQMSAQLGKQEVGHMTSDIFWNTFTRDLQHLTNHVKDSTEAKEIVRKIYSNKGAPQFRKPLATHEAEQMYQKMFQEEHKFSYIMPFWEPYGRHRPNFIYHKSVARKDKPPNLCLLSIDCANSVLKLKDDEQRTAVVRIGKSIYLPYLDLLDTPIDDIK